MDQNLAQDDIICNIIMVFMYLGKCRLFAATENIGFNLSNGIAYTKFRNIIL